MVPRKADSPPFSLLVAYGNPRVVDALLGQSTLRLPGGYVKRLVLFLRCHLPAPTPHASPLD